MFDTCLNKVWYDEEEEIIHGISTGVFNLTSYSGPPTDSTIISPDKAVVFPSIYDTTTLLAYSVLSPSSDTIYPASSPSSPPSDNILLASSPTYPHSDNFSQPPSLPPFPLKDISWTLPYCLHLDELTLLAFTFVLSGIELA